MRRLLLLVAGFCCVGAAATLEGRWNLESNRLTLMPAGVAVGIGHVFYITKAEAESFTVVRSAGTIRLNRRGGFEFEENPEFVAALRALGADTSRILEMASENVNVAYLRNLELRGFKNLSAQDVRRIYYSRSPVRPVNPVQSDAVQELLRRHGVSAEYLRQLQESGYRLFAEDAVRLKENGVKPELVQQLQRAGFTSYGNADFIKLQAGGVTELDVQRLQNSGQRDLSADEIVQLKNDGRIQ